MKKEEIKSLEETLADYRINNLAKIRSSMKYNYGKLRARKELIVRALIFWKFIQNTKPLKDMKARREFLAKFIADENHYIGVVAMVESLPTSVWRKILWKHNINFMSFESFLRRITIEQIEWIRGNYQDLFEKNIVPRVFTGLDCFAKKITVEKLQSESLYYNERNISKGSWSHNLLGLNFGFNEYINGTADDTKIMEFSPLRFLSVKNHADDFVVNQEDGMYWRLYRTARSNYAWKWDRSVQLKTHICPGFWYTLLVHLLFWIVSPAAFIGLMSIFAVNSFSGTSWWHIGLLSIPSVATPLWLTVAGFRLFFRYIFTEERRESIIETIKSVKRWFEKHENITIVPAGIIAFIIIALAVLNVAFLALMKIYEWLYPVFGTEGIVKLGLAFIIYVGYKIYFKYKYDRLPKFKQYPLYWRIPILLVVVWLSSKGLILYHEQLWIVFLWVVNFVDKFWSFIIKILVDFAETIWYFILGMKFMIPLMLIPFALIGGVWLLERIIDEKKMERIIDGISKYFGQVIISLFTLYVIAMMPFMFQSGFNFNIEIVVGFLILGLLFFGAYYILYKYDPKTNKLEWVVSDVNETTSKLNEVSEWYLYRNIWIKSLNREEAYMAVRRTVKILSYIFGRRGYRAYGIVFPRLTEKLLNRLKNSERELNALSEKIALRAIRHMAKKDYGAERAISLATSQINSEEKMLKAIETVLRVVFCWLVVIWMILKQIFKLLKLMGEWVITIPRLYKLFNERCPFVTQTKVLSI